jgi:hypothetical protein
VSATPFRVVLSGDTGNLCLAQDLKKSDVDGALYEHERTRIDDLLGYRIGTGPDGSRVLHACSPSHSRVRCARRVSCGC